MHTTNVIFNYLFLGLTRSTKVIVNNTLVHKWIIVPYSFFLPY
jgi:hypothetical protein